LFRGDAAPHAFGNFIARLRPGKGVLSEYLFYYLWQFHSSGKTSHYQKQTTGIRNLEFKRYLTIPVPVCPIAEQQRIVDQLSRAEGIVRLRRQAQQKAAELIPAIFVDMFGDPATNPKGWPVFALSEVSEVISGVAKGRDLSADESIELPYMRVANVKDGRLDLDEVKTIRIKNTEVEKLRIVPGDLLMTEGGDPDKLGRAALWRGEIGLCVHQNHIFKVRSRRDRLVPEYLRSLVGSAYGKAYFLSVAKKTTGIASINKTQLSAFPVLVPPLPAQEDFRLRVEAVEGIGVLQEAAARQAEATFRSLLAKAFTETGPQVHREMEEAHA
jgi:type I restriction enzyme S subunit